MIPTAKIFDRLINPIPVSFRSPEARAAFSAEWKRRTGRYFRPLRNADGEAIGFWLRCDDDLTRAADIALTVSGVNLFC